MAKSRIFMKLGWVEQLMGGIDHVQYFLPRATTIGMAVVYDRNWIFQFRPKPKFRPLRRNFRPKFRPKLVPHKRQYFEKFFKVGKGNKISTLVNSIRDCKRK